MDNFDDLFANGCILPCIGEVEKPFVPQRKDLNTLLAELEVIKNNIEEVKAKEWHLAKLIKFNKAEMAE